MDYRFLRRIIAFIFTIIMLMFIGFGFCYSNETNDYYRENSMIFNDYWKVDGKMISFPYSNSDEFTMSNTLPQVYGDQLLIIRCYYTDFVAYIDGEEIIESRGHVLFGHETDIGNKEIWIPLESDYTGKEISIKINLQKSLYRNEVVVGFITTRSAYWIAELVSNVPSIILFILFTFTGIFEVIIASFFILRRTHLIRKLSFEALQYAGFFSIVSAQWVINETRIPFIAFGYMTGFSVLTIITFLMMPLLFFELSRAVFFRVGKKDNIIDTIFVLMVLVSCTLATTGIIEWRVLIYIAHLLDIFVMIMVSYYSYKSVKEENVLNARSGIAAANGIFILIAGFALIQYINNNSSTYFLLIIIDLMIYVFVQVGLIYRRIGLNVKEENEFAMTKIYAFTDELTGLSNRRHFYRIIEDFERHKLPATLTYIAIDVNLLKQVNDTMGHEAGDELLKGTAKCIRSAFSSNSTSTISRMGGDEFAILLLATEAEIKKRIDSLQSSLKNYRKSSINGISIAIGYASVKDYPEYTLDELGKVADEYMYQDKKKFYESSGLDRRK